MPNAFTTLSPEKQRESVRPAEVWPFLRVAWQTERQQLLGDVRHRASAVDVKMLPLLGNPMYVSPHLWWFVLTAPYASYLGLDALTDHASQHSWLPYPQLVTKFLTWAAKATTPERREFLQACRAHISEFGDGPVSALYFLGLVDLIAGTEQVKPVLLRVCVLHRLSTWAAAQDGLTLACKALLRQDKEGDKVGWSYAPCPLTAREWQAELAKHEKSGKLLTTDARARLTALSVTTPAHEGQPASSPAWKRVLRAGALVEDEDILRHLEGLRSLPDSAAPVAAAALSSLLTEGQFDLGTRTAVQLSSASTAAELSLAANSAWTACTADQRRRLRVQLSEYLRDVMATYGPAVDKAAVNATLARLAPIIVEAAQRGYSTWTMAAATISSFVSLSAAVLSPLSKAVSLESFTLALRDPLDLLTTAAQHETLVLKVTEALSGTSDTDWFVSGALRPTGAPQALALRPALMPARHASSSSAARSLHLPVTPGFQPPTTTPPTSCVRVSALDACDPVEATSELSVALGTPVYIGAPDVARGFGFVTVPSELYRNLFALATRRTYTFPSGAECVFVALAPNNDPLTPHTDNNLNVPLAQRIPSKAQKRPKGTSLKPSKAQRRAQKTQGTAGQPPDAGRAEGQLQAFPPGDSPTARTVHYSRGHPWDGQRHG